MHYLGGVRQGLRAGDHSRLPGMLVLRALKKLLCRLVGLHAVIVAGAQQAVIAS